MSEYSITLSGFSAIYVSFSLGARENGKKKLGNVCSQATLGFDVINLVPRTLVDDSGFLGKRSGYEIMMYLRLRGRLGSCCVELIHGTVLETQSVFSFYFEVAKTAP